MGARISSLRSGAQSAEELAAAEERAAAAAEAEKAAAEEVADAARAEDDAGRTLRQFQTLLRAQSLELAGSIADDETEELSHAKHVSPPIEPASVRARRLAVAAGAEPWRARSERSARTRTRASSRRWAAWRRWSTSSSTGRSGRT